MSNSLMHCQVIVLRLRLFVHVGLRHWGLPQYYSGFPLEPVQLQDIVD